MTTHGKCKHCSKKIKVTNGLSGLSSHMEFCHSSRSKSKPLVQTKLNLKPAPLTTNVQRPKDFSIDKAKRLFTEMIILDDLPFDITKNDGFLKFIQYTCPAYEDLVMDGNDINAEGFRMRDELMTDIQFQLNNSISRISFTCDIWTCPHTNARYMVISAHFISKEWKYTDIILGLKRSNQIIQGKICGTYLQKFRNNGILRRKLWG